MNDGLHLSKAGLNFIKSFEGLRLRAYYDAVHVLTIGYGHTNMDGVAPHVTVGLTITTEQAEEILARSLAVHYEAAVKRIVTVPLAQTQFDALVSFCYNCGEANLRRLVRELNAGDYDSVPKIIIRYNRAGGKVLAGLTRRRLGEAAMWKAAPTSSLVAAHIVARIDAPEQAAVSGAVDTPPDLPDTVAKWGGAVSPFAMVMGYATDWRVLAVVCAAVLIGGGMYLYWRKKNT